MRIMACSSISDLKILDDALWLCSFTLSISLLRGIFPDHCFLKLFIGIVWVLESAALVLDLMIQNWDGGGGWGRRYQIGISLFNKRSGLLSPLRVEIFPYYV